MEFPVKKKQGTPTYSGVDITPSAIAHPIVLSHCNWAGWMEFTYPSFQKQGLLPYAWCQEVYLPSVLRALSGEKRSGLKRLVAAKQVSIFVLKKVKIMAVSFQCIKRKKPHSAIYFF